MYYLFIYHGESQVLQQHQKNLPRRYKMETYTTQNNTTTSYNSNKY